MSRGTESNTTGQRTLTGKRIVVTGGTGLVGSHLVAELLRQDCRVRLLVREGSRFDRLGATLQRMGTAVEAGRLERYEAALNNPLELADALRGPMWFFIVRPACRSILRRRATLWRPILKLRHR